MPLPASNIDAFAPYERCLIDVIVHTNATMHHEGSTPAKYLPSGAP